MNKEELAKYAQMYLHYELYWSALLVGQELLPGQSPADFYVVLKSLYHLGYHKKLVSILDHSPDLFKFQQIRLLYLKSGRDCAIQSALCIEIPQHDVLDLVSVEMFFTALSKAEARRKALLLQSFEQDRRNIEPLLYLFMESLCTTSEICQLVEEIPSPDLAQIFHKLLFGDTSLRSCVSPLAIFSASVRVALEKTHNIDTAQLFRSCVRHFEQFDECPFIYIGMGTYYLSRQKAKEALRCFQKANELNKNIGVVYVLAALSHSKLKETENAVKILDKAYEIMLSSYIPAYCLAQEYQLMNNVQKAKHYYKRSILLMEAESFRSVKRTKQSNEIDLGVMNAYLYCLIYNEEYAEAMSCMDKYGINNVLKAFCLLFTGMLEEAKTVLDGCRQDHAYYACKGFICHLVDELDGAIKCYEQSLASEQNAVVENLLLMAYENQGNVKSNRAFDYSNCLFESLGTPKK